MEDKIDAPDDNRDGKNSDDGSKRANESVSIGVNFLISASSESEKEFRIKGQSTYIPSLRIEG